MNKNLINSLRLLDKNIDIHILRSSENVNIDTVLGFKDNNGKHSFIEHYDEN